MSAQTRSRLASSRSIALRGMAGATVEIEAMIAPGLPRTVMVGLPDTAVYEARDRCKAAVVAAGFAWPSAALTINLTPADLPKKGSHHDVAICAAVLAAAGHLPTAALASVVLLGELGLDGRIRPVRGVLPATVAAQELGYRDIIVPFGQGSEARLVEGMNVRTAASVSELVAVLCGDSYGEAPEPPVQAGPATPVPDFRDVVGQPMARWAAEVAAAGRHHMMLTGPAGIGKTLIASRLPGILPPLSPQEALEVAAVRSLLGHPVTALESTPPFAEPHHTTPLSSMVGGGAGIARPGAITRAHGGVLFLDEATELRPGVLDALRLPLESGEVVLTRTLGEARYPARFQLVMATNPCPCGNHGIPGRTCACTPATVRRYGQRISGPVRDRVDIAVAMHAGTTATMGVGAEEPESSAEIAGRVRAACQRQTQRLSGTQWRRNADLPGPFVRRELPPPEGMGVVHQALARGELSPRGVDSVIRVAWSIADLAGHDRPTIEDTFAAMALRRAGTPTLPTTPKDNR